MCPGKYAQKAVRNCKAHLATNYSGRFRLPLKSDNPFKMGYGLDLDASLELEPDAASYFQTIIGILRWMTEFERIDIIFKVTFLFSHLSLPKEGHLIAAVHVMAYVGQKYSSRLVYDPSYPDIDHHVFKKCDRSEFY